MLHDEFTAVNSADNKDSSGWFTAVNFYPTRSEATLPDRSINRMLPCQSRGQVTISKEVWKDPLSIIQRKRQPHWSLRRCGGQVSGGRELAQRTACGTLGRLEHNLRVTTFQCTMPKNGRNQIGCAFVIDGIRNKTTIALVQSAEIEQLCRERDLVERHFQEPFAERF